MDAAPILCGVWEACDGYDLSKLHDGVRGSCYGTGTTAAPGQGSVASQPLTAIDLAFTLLHLLHAGES
jgi:hypothetical protein